MRPLLVDLGPAYRGGQHQALLLLQGIHARGHSPQLIALRDSLLARRARECGIPVHSIDPTWRRIGAARVIRKLLSSGGADLVHANEPHALTGAWLARAHRRVPVIASRRVIFPLGQGAISRSRYRAATRIIAVSHYVERQLAACGFAGDQVALIPDGVVIPPPRSVDARAEARSKLGIPVNIPLLGCVAALTPDKGQDLLILALAGIRHRIPDCQLLLVGEGPRRALLNALALEMKLDRAVRFVTATDDLNRVYDAIDAFAFPAHAEALGSALLLAMAHGLPCVALARGGIPDAVNDGVNGVLIQKPRVEEWAAALERVLTNSAEAERLGAEARATIIQRFSADRMVDATLELYAQALNK